MSADLTRPTILLVDDDEIFRERLRRALDERGFAVQTAGDVAAGLALARAEPPEYAVVDLRMPGPSGLALVEALHALDAGTHIVVLTGWGSVATAVDAMKKGATHYLQKPVSLDELLAALHGEDVGSATTEDLLPSLARQEWEYIHKVLGECGDNISEAARRLGLHRRSLQRKLQKLPPPR
jgi:two-component system, response regulator RegA